MSWYAEQIFPRLMDWVMRGEEFQRLRANLLKNARGDVLEIGFGTGLNLAHYPPSISSLSIVDPARILPRRVMKRTAAVSFPIHIQHVTAETLSFPDRRFDTVVSTWTLCTISDPIQALREVRRVLKPDGRFLFLEHGRSAEETVATWQDRLNPIQRVVGCGCNLNRRIDQLVQQAGFATTELNRFVMQTVPQIGGEMYKGTAIKA